MSAFAWLSRERTVARPGYSRWLVPPSALAIHLAIGQGYALSVFNLPMSRLIGIKRPSPEDWPLTTTVWLFNIAFFMLGASAFVWGKWLERVGPRKAMFASAVFFAGGLALASLGVSLHNLFVLYASFVVYGVGLGLGYIAPVSTLIKWFPDRPGMATGMAIMGFGGGALIGSPLAQNLMDRWSGPRTTGVAQALLAMGALYFVFMMFGVITVRVPPPGYAATVRERSGREQGGRLLTTVSVTADEAIKTPQFWLLWSVLFLNVTAGIGVLSQASPFIQETFGGRVTPSAAAGFVGFISVFNLAGRLFWSSVSDYIGRKATYMVYFILGAALYCAVPTLGRWGSISAFVGAFAIIFTMYGGGFATVPAYLKDLFGVDQVGAIHGRLLTAWSAAAIAGPSLVTYMREYQLRHGVPTADSYARTMYLMAGLLGIGLVCNARVSPVHARHFMEEKKR